MSGWDYYWDKGVLVRLPGGFWTGGAEMYRRPTREWLEYGFRADLEGRPITAAAAMRYVLTGIRPNRHDRPDRPPLSVAEAEAAADGLATGEWPDLEGVREILTDYVEQHAVDEADDLPDDPDADDEEEG